MDPYLKLLALVAVLFFLPKLLLRLAIPSPLTELALGVAAGPLVLGLVHPDELLGVLSGFGISALFLFAGLEVETEGFWRRRKPLFQHLAIQLVLFGIVAAVGSWLGGVMPVAVLFAVALMTPSAGFIIPALDAMGLPESLSSWIKQKAIATEIMAIATVLLFANTASGRELLLGLGGIATLILAVPVIFILFHNTILRWAPKTEFSFMLIVALMAAYVTHHLGVHYFVGAFLVGLTARRYLDWCRRKGVAVGSVFSALSSFRFFSAFFVPFFFFLAGAHLPHEALTREALLLAAGLITLAVPLRAASVIIHRKVSLGESWREAWTVGLLLGPTTVFSVAVAEILRDRFELEGWWVGGLILYGAATSLLPLAALRFHGAEFEEFLSQGEYELEHTGSAPR